MVKQQTNQNQIPKILFVDDEEGILASARRIFRGKNLDVKTEQSPQRALELIQNEDFDVVISDYRMPGMTGTELLEQVKIKKPYVTRLMLTGFLEFQVIQEAINKAAVFRFITKPWDEADLVLGVESAVNHTMRLKTNTQLVHEIGDQNQKLELLSHNLETEVFKRTQNIEESRELAESKQRIVRDLVSFVKNLSKVTSSVDLFESFNQELWRYQGVSVVYLMILEGSERGRLIWNQARTLHEKVFMSLPEHFDGLALRTDFESDIQWWKTSLKKDPNQLVAVPVKGREAGISRPLALIFIDHNLKKEKLATLLDRITERLQVVSIVLDKILLTEQLVAATLQWQATFSAFNDPIAVVDNQEKVIRANKSFFKDQKTQCYEMLDDRTEICDGCPMPDALLKMAPASNLVRTKKQKTFRVNSYPVKSTEMSVDGGSFDRVVRVVNHYTDISRERELYMKLVQSEKLAAVGLLAGNIAHELNNPLSGLRAMAQVLKTEVPNSSNHYQDLSEIEKAAVRCQDIIKNLLNFSQSPQSSTVEVDINEVIASTLPLLKTALRNQSLQTHLEESLPKVKAQASQLQQVFFNLLNNACQAMAQGGTIIIKTWVENDKVWISFQDNGPGIPVEIQQRIFEPFFTTKEVGVGTGLGLSVSKNIVEKFGGEMILESRPERGTAFIISFPFS